MKFKKLTLLMVLMLMAFLSSVNAQQCVGNYLTAQGNKLYDSNGNVVQLTGVNWFGFETAMLYPHGIWSRDTKSMLQQIKDQGFNCIRIPWCNKILSPSSTIQINSYGSDPYTGVTPMNEVEATKTKPIEIMDIIVEWCQVNNMKIILDNHSRNPDGYMSEGLWYTAEVSHTKWIEDWIFMANRYKSYDAVVAMDINNEPHGKYGADARWGTGNPANDWRLAAQECGNAILTVNPNVLIMVEGTEEFEETSYWWGGNLQGARNYPVVLSNPSKLVYSPHEYGPTVHPQVWFSDASFPANMPGIWEANFNYLHTNGTSPLFVGEFGIRDAFGVDEVWFDTFLAFMGAKGYSWTFWCWNPNSGDTGGLLDDQWKTVVQWKMDKLTPYLAAEIPNCGGGGGVNKAPIAKITVNLSSGGLPVTATYNASQSSDPDGDAITYSWNNGSSAETFQVVYTTAGNYNMALSVSDGQAIGTNSVTVTISDNLIPVTGVSIAPTSLQLTAGNTGNVTAMVLPENATNKNVSYTSTNTSIATVSQNGLVSALVEGTASITVTTADGGFTATCSIIVIPGGNGCSFTGQSNPLATVQRQYNYIHVIGNGPNLSNVTNFTINWDLPNKGLWQLSMNTNNGQPSWWNDLNPKVTQSFGSANPAISLSGTGFPGLDGNYWVTMDGDNLVWIEKTGAYSIYFSTSAADPCGNKSGSIAASSKISSNHKVIIYPVPAENQLSIVGLTDAFSVEIFSILGQSVLKQSVNSQVVTIDVSNLQKGTYILHIVSTTQGSRNEKILIK
jgi:aryl-phospho-beta-D-glucosidase BglC (GH1 family)